MCATNAITFAADPPPPRAGLPQLSAGVRILADQTGVPRPVGEIDPVCREGGVAQISVHRLTAVVVWT
jgi:hypothetical protein